MLEGVPEAVRARLSEPISPGRVGEPGEIAHCVTYLCSAFTGWVTGAVIDINGG
ncbi:MAG TPA: hypothetical protein DEP84_13790 [Chloroflexi bacterium]|nr:hypothetical protein [Chloroflexota bacterium]